MAVANGAYAQANPQQQPAQQPAQPPKAPKEGDAGYKGRGLESYKRMFARAEEAHGTARQLAHRDRDWYDNFNDNQWSDDEKKILAKRSQPPSTSNRLRKKIRFLRGIEQRQRSDPKGLPRNQVDTKSANVVTDVLDYVEQETRFDHTASQSFKDLAIEGIEAAEVIVENGDQPVVNLIQYDCFFYDPRSKKEDFSDAKYLGYQDWFDQDEAIELAIAMGLTEEEAKEIIQNSFEEVTDEGYEDKPFMFWGDSDRKRVRIACMYWKDAKGVWNYVYYTGGGVIKEGVSVYLDDKGKPDCAIVAASVYLTRKNERYGVLRDDISPQQEINHRKAKTMFLMSNRRMWQRGPGILPPDASDIVARADGVLTANGTKDVDWGFIDSTAEVSENFQFLQEAKQEIDGHGPNPGLSGEGTQDQSGRAIALQQNAGMAEENDIYDIHNDWKLRIYRKMWFRAKQYWTAEKVIRITDDMEAPRYVTLNTMAPMQDEQTGEPLLDHAGQPMMGPSNMLAEMDADIILQAAPDSITLQHEEFQELSDMAKAGVPIPPDVLILASQIRDKEKLVKRMQEEGGKDAMLQQAAQQIEQLQQALQAMQKQLEKAQQMPVQKPPTVVDMAKVDESRAKTDHTRMQTAALAKEIMAPPEMPEPPPPPTALDGAKVELTYAQADKTRVDTAKVVHDINNPPPPPQRPNGSTKPR